ncbi:MAG: FAD-dependent oxidoreductase [Proteobacteria bacterium]|nr:FAD-dependent oxidoreductase [Pseudomonadota bacterium]
MKIDALTLAHGLTFDDLYDRDGLVRLDGVFLDVLGAADPALARRLMAARGAPGAGSGSLTRLEESELILDVAPHLERFIGRLFGISDELAVLRGEHKALAPVFEVRRNFVQRRALKKIKADAAGALDGDSLAAELVALLGEPLSELAFARGVTEWLAEEAAELKTVEEETTGAALDAAQSYAAWATLTPAGRARHGGGVLFREPGKLDFDHLVHNLVSEDIGGAACHRLDEGHLRRREGFALTDAGVDLAGALGEANYCIWCHKQGRDSCSTGLREKAAKDEPGPAPFRRSPFGVSLAGCPLEEKISEFQMLKAGGVPLGAFAVMTIDNPMVAATGHRICNDCMKSCVYQKQDPVDIPQAETRTLKDVLALPWGFEIYSLLTRWNPLNLTRPYPKLTTKAKVLVVGMGPAGFTLAHHLMNDGHAVAGIDGLKIEPLPEGVSGVTPTGGRAPFAPVRDVEDLYESLDERVMAGFGGVAEYGITVRWDKNYLKLIRLLLERRSQFALFGGVRFGGTITLEDAWAMGFDHVALCAGAGRPTVIDMPNNLARGVRTASDFLMALQLTGAARKDSIANMQLRLPAVVIGGGLTAIDTATEALAYYPRQVEKFLACYEALVADKGEAAVRAPWDAEEAGIADEFLSHARAIRDEHEAAGAAGREADVLALLRGWGGVTIAYRKRLVDSPAYTLNHEEVEKALEEGIAFVECLSPVAVELDEHKHACGLRLSRQKLAENGRFEATGGSEGGEITLPARAIFMAAGTQPNTVLAREDSTHFHLDGRYFQAIDEAGDPVSPEKSAAKPNEIRVLMSKAPDGRFTSFFGDLHPSWFGNVVKAMGSAKQGYPVVSRVLEAVEPASATDAESFLASLSSELRPVVERVERLTPTIIEIVLRAPRAAAKFQPGQFYRLQNFETLAPRIENTTLAMEGLALTGAWVDPQAGLISLIVLEMGGSSSLCRYLKPGEPVILMGPTGAPTDIPTGETILLAGGGLGNAVLFSIGQAMRAAGNKVLYFAGYKQISDRYKIEEIERAADAIIWCCDEAPGFELTRPQDRALTGNIVEAMRAYASGELGDQAIPFADTDRIVAIGSDRMMAAVAAARHGVLKPFLKQHHFAIGSINSPMQCMMKEICAQCLQPHIDPETGERSYVFSCFNQDQPLDHVDWPGLSARLRQNSVQEKLKAQWITHCARSLEGGV